VLIWTVSVIAAACLIPFPALLAANLAIAEKPTLELRVSFDDLPHTIRDDIFVAVADPLLLFGKDTQTSPGEAATTAEKAKVKVKQT
jgi:hypothetical protein